MRLQAVVVLMILVGFGAARAQDATDDWEVVRREEPPSIMAGTRFSNGIVVGVRCVGDSLETLISGLPPASRGTVTRRIGHAFGDQTIRDSDWWISEDRTSIFANFPAGMARQLRQGGQLQVRLPGEDGGPAQRFVVSVPPSPAAIEDVLTACDRPLVDPRDLLRTDTVGDTPVGNTWARNPRPTYPESALQQGYPGVAVLSCLTHADGRLHECQVEAERPANFGFGYAALRAARSARLRSDEEYRPTEGGVVTFTITWKAL